VRFRLTTPTPPLADEAKLATLATEFGQDHPCAAASPREGLTDTPSILRLQVPPTLGPQAAVDKSDRVDDLHMP
jgi:hypothetical protein